MSVDLVAPVLHFLAEVSKEMTVKDWLGGSEGCVFWPVLLRVLCAAPMPLGPSDQLQKMKVCTSISSTEIYEDVS